MTTETAAGLDHGRLLFEAIQQKREKRWEQIASLLARVPETLDGAGLGLADEVAFALGQLGDLRSEAGDADGALRAWRTALPRDRTGRHLTLDRIGDADRRAGRLREAERAYNEALEFRRRRFLSDDVRALRGLVEVNRSLGRDDRVRELGRRLEGARPARNGSKEDVA